MIDHTLFKPAGAVVLAGAAAAALTVGQSAFATGRAATGHTAPAACAASGRWPRTAPAPPVGWLAGCGPGARRGAPGAVTRPRHYLTSVR
jgi:hypothetical protein